MILVVVHKYVSLFRKLRNSVCECNVPKDRNQSVQKEKESHWST